MDRDIIAELHEHERKVLPLLLKHSSVDDMVQASDMKKAQIVRALQWLHNKNLVQIKEKLSELIELDINGDVYRKKGLPEKRFLDAVIKAKKIHKYDLIDELHISESKYEKLKPYMEYKFGYAISYDKKNKNWMWEREDESDN